MTLDSLLPGGFAPPAVVPPCPSSPSERKIRAVSERFTGPDELVTLCQQGDKAAFRDLFNRHRSDVARIVFRMLGPVAEVEDVIQDVFVQVFRCIGDFQGKSKFSTWLHRVSVNVVRMHRRAQRSRPNLSDEIPTDLKGEELGPDEDVMRRERIRAFYAVLERLPEKKRTVFILHEIEGLNPKEIAKIVDAPPLTIRTRLFYARRDLIRLLRAEPSLAALADVMLRPGSADLASDDSKEKKS
ncbi:MAG: RNA polymerase subunit sigma [Sorangium cellulosum]|nr:MAG: RNA polymerase subunit sigma [Sorangium cellulosum]